MYQMVYDHHFSHSIIHITAISSLTPSSTACPVGVQFLPRMRGGSAVLSSTTTYCGMLLWSREHRSSMTMHIPSIDQLPRWGSRVLTVSFPSPAQPLNLCMNCEENIPCHGGTINPYQPIPTHNTTYKHHNPYHPQFPMKSQ